jgi:alpha-amylase
MEKSKQFLRGGMWRNFQNLYDESNWMQKRVSDLSFIFEQYKNKIDKKNRKLAQEHLWKAQCNCAYWHGVFGGLYLPHLRHGIFENLIAADKIVSKVLPPFTGTYDIDNDGFEEVDLVSKNIKIIASTKGACIREFDILNKNFNILNTMHQLAESYHRDLANASTDQAASGSIHDNVVMKEANLDKVLNVDKFPRYSLTDHFYPNRVSLNDVQRGKVERGNFAVLEFAVNRDKNIIFKGIGKAFDSDIKITKKIGLNTNTLTVNIILKNESEKIINGIYGSELNFALLGGHSDDRYFIINGKKPKNAFLDSSKIDSNIKSIKIVNDYDKFSIETKFKNPTRLWRFPVLTVSGSEAGLEKVYQSSVVIPNWKLNLKPNKKVKVEFKIIIKEF